MASNAGRGTLYRSIWRWHFYAALFVMPMVVILSITGGIYLFKPQIERWEERAWQGLPTAHAVNAGAQRDAALAAFPGATFTSYRLPERLGDAVLIAIKLPDGQGVRDVFVSPQGKVLGSLDPQWRISQVAHDIHGQLLIGQRGSWLVELAASWAIVMILTGLYLWWPAGRGFAGAVWPRLRRGSRVLLRDLHAVTGFWVSGLALVLLLTGLPWADVWGSGFKSLRQEMGWINGPQDWTIGGQAPDADEHAAHRHPGRNTQGSGRAERLIPLDAIVAKAESERLAFPVLVTPPGAPRRFGKQATADWTVRSDTPNRPLRVTVTYDGQSGAERTREVFADKHPIDRVIGYGIAWHEGALFGLANQFVGLATVLALITLAITGFILWWRRKPVDTLGAPAALHGKRRSPAVVVVGVLLFVTLPLFAVSLVVFWLFDRLALPRMPGLARWLGVQG